MPVAGAADGPDTRRAYDRPPLHDHLSARADDARRAPKRFHDGDRADGGRRHRRPRCRPCAWSSAARPSMPRTARPSRSSTRRPARPSPPRRWAARSDVDRAVAAAQEAFEAPEGLVQLGRRQARPHAREARAQLVKENTEELAQLESRNAGKPITSARGEITGVSLVFDYYAGAANKIFGQTIPVSKPGLDLTLTRADRRRRADRAVELPDANGELEARAGAGRRQHLHPQAGLVLADDRAAARRAGPRGGLPARRHQRRHRPGRHRRRRDRGASRASARSPSRARPRPARRSCGWPRTT